MTAIYTYPNLSVKHWRLGVHDVHDLGWQDPWVVVTPKETVGAWSRAEARYLWDYYNRYGTLEGAP